MRRIHLAAGIIAIVIAAVAVVSLTLMAPGEEERGVPEPLRQLVPEGVGEIDVWVAFLDKPGAELPKQYTCDSPTPEVPSIRWSRAEDAQSYAIIVVDPDAPRGPFYHLVVYDIPGDQLAWPPGGVLGVNSAGKPGWYPACPPKGHGVHRYYFVVLALSTRPSLGPGLSADQFLEIARGSIVAAGYTYGVYGR